MRRRPVAVTHLHRRNPFAALLLCLGMAALVAYFGYHAFTGALGIWSMDAIRAQSADLSTQLAALQKQRADLEAQVARMRPQSLDADLVDTTARGQLGLMRPDEVVIGPAASR
jgi:cell division protein FtsB